MNENNNSQKLEVKNILDMLFLQREDEIYQITENERELSKKKSEDYSKIYTAIDNIPEAFVETRKGIEKSIEIYLNTLGAVQANENEKFYKTGFSDAIKLTVDCLCKNADNRKEL